MKWAIEIQNTSLEKRNLSDLLFGLGFELIEGIEYPAMASKEIDACLTATEVYEKAKAVKTAFKDSTKIDPKFVLGSVIEFATNPPRTHAFLEVQSIVLKTTFGQPTLTISPPEGLSLNQLKQLKINYEEQKYQLELERQRSKLEPAYLNPRAAKVLKLLAIDRPTAETIYKIYELAEENPKNRTNFHNQFGISKENFNRFKDAVHNPSVTGDWARHAYLKEPLTSNPMTKNEAETFIRKLADKWLASLRKDTLRDRPT